MTDHRLVPVEPTPKMLAAGQHDLAGEIYADMLAAAPAVQGEPVAEVVWPDVEGRRGGFRQFGHHSSPRLPAGTKLYAAQQPAEQGEPVGYVRPHHLEMLRSGKVCGITMEDRPDERNGVTVPLFASTSGAGCVAA